MIAMHIESGLGNQMHDYVDFLAAKKVNSDKEIVIENLIYELPQDKLNVSMWNGYELDKIFNIKEKNLKDYFSQSEWNDILKIVENSKFWEKHWTYSKAITDAINKIGSYEMKSINKHWTDPDRPVRETNLLLQKIRKSHLAYFTKRHLFKLLDGKVVNNIDFSQTLFSSITDFSLTGHFLLCDKKNSGIEILKDEIRQAFTFPVLDSINAIFYENVIQRHNSVAIHARRGDMLGACGYCYKYGYFKRAVNFIRDRVVNPVFIFFTNTGSIDWCKQNLEIFGLSKSDTIYFVTWNLGIDSFRDMQLMSMCNHNIITESSFGWWAAYLNDNPSKITCSPDIRINTTHSF